MSGHLATRCLCARSSLSTRGSRFLSMEANQDSLFAEADITRTRDLLEQKARRRTISQSLRKVNACACRSNFSTVSELESLGSSQTRNTSYQPHHSLHSPVSSSALTTSHLLASAAHLGHNSSLVNPAYYPHLYGTRHSISVIDVRQTLVGLKRAANVIKSVVEQDGLVVFVGSPATSKATELCAKRLGKNGYSVSKWRAGLSTLYDRTSSY